NLHTKEIKLTRTLDSQVIIRNSPYLLYSETMQSTSALCHRVFHIWAGGRRCSSTTGGAICPGYTWYTPRSLASDVPSLPISIHLLGG
uniref:Uncharacterized protein n=1 Tax=Kryptolebias marmoratus TaxID=37003 RepID=A0A3Q3GKK3_KRYMA